MVSTYKKKGKKENYPIFLISFAESATSRLGPSFLPHKEFLEANQAVRLPALLLDDALVELPQTEGAHKVLRVKLAAQGRDAAARDGLAAASTQGALAGVVVERAEQSAVQLHEAAVSEGLPALLGGSGGEEHREGYVYGGGGMHGV